LRRLLAPGDSRAPQRLAAGVLLALSLGCRARADDGRERRSAAVIPSDSTPVTMTVDLGRRFPISRFVYGVNGFGMPADPTTAPWPRGITLSRFGGNRLTAYNWENNASTAGLDYNFQNDAFLGSDSASGEAVRRRVVNAMIKGAGIIVTVPMIGHVARDADGTNVGTDPGTLRSRLAARFVASRPVKGGPFAATPDRDDDYVAQDEFVWWLTRKFPGATSSATTPIFFCLDNEPDLWGSTHEELAPKEKGEIAHLTYDDIVERTVAYARAIKNVAPEAVVFGPGTATWAGAATLGRWPKPDPRYGSQFFLDVYLDRMREAERREGRRLLDVLDIHWYPAAASEGNEVSNDMAPQTDAMVWARLQAPRSLWDSTYDEKSWVSGVQNGPIRLLPLLREKIAAHYPGTKLAVTEYYYGRGGDISGGIAQADVLGIFGREGVFAATLWPNANIAAVPYGSSPERAYRYVIGAFRMYRDFDGRGGAFGSTGLGARTSDPATSSVYASTDDSAATRIVVVAINKLPRPRRATIQIAGGQGWRDSVEVYALTEESGAPRRGRDLAVTGGHSVQYTLPPMSVSTLVLRR
jgi:hypothetical protein